MRVVGEDESRNGINQHTIERPLGLIVGGQIVGVIGHIDQDMVHVRKPKRFRHRRGSR